MINFNTLLADSPLPDPTTLGSPSSAVTNPMIDHGGQLIVYIRTFLIVLGIGAIVGFFSRRVEHALITTLVFSLCLVAFFAFTR